MWPSYTDRLNIRSGLRAVWRVWRSSRMNTFVTNGYKSGVCAGCKVELTANYSGWVRGVGIFEQGALSVRVCKDTRHTDPRYQHAKRSCLVEAQKRVAKVTTTEIEGIAKSDIERALEIWLRRVR
jgi:hypothetical protein